MTVLDRSTFNEYLDRGIDVMLNNFTHIIEVSSFEQPSLSSDSMVFKDKYKIFQEHRLLCRAAANIFDSASVILGLCSEIKRELLINGFSHENLSAKARHLTLVEHIESSKLNIESFSKDLESVIETLENSLYGYNQCVYSNDELENNAERDSDSSSSVSLNLPHY